MTRSKRLASRDSIRAFLDQPSLQLLIVATGEASAGVRVEIDEVSPPTTPLSFRLVAIGRPGVWPAVVQPYRASLFVTLPGDPATVRITGQIEVQHADGVDRVQLEAMPPELVSTPTAPGGGRSATGYSSSLSFDEAFQDAVASLTHGATTSGADELVRVTVDEIGGLFGGLAGLRHLFVRLSTVEAASPRPTGDVIVEVAPDRPAGDVVRVEIATERPYSDVIVEVAPERPGPIEEIAPERPYSDVIVEVAPERPGPIEEIAPERPYSDVIVEVAPERPGPIEEIAPERPDGDVIVEVAPERPGPIEEIAPERPDGDVIVEVAPERPGPIQEVAPERPGPIVEVAPERPGPIEEIAPERPAGELIVEVAPERPAGRAGDRPVSEVRPEGPTSDEPGPG